MKYVFLLSFLFVSVVTNARNYYVSSSGNDDAAGTISAPWLSIDKVNRFRFKAGDSILFRRGDIFCGGLLCQSGDASRSIVYGDYGTGSLPVISGFRKVDEWDDLGNGVFESKQVVSNLPSLAMVLVNGNRVAMGRFPNADDENGGFITISSHAGNNAVSAARAMSGNYNGGVIVIRKKHWVFDRNKIVGSSTFSFNYDLLPGSAKQYEPERGFGFFIQDHPATLDQFGEWCYRNGKLQVYLGRQTASVQVAAVQTIARLKPFVVLDNLRLQGANENLVEGSGLGIEIRGCELFFAGRNGIYVSGGVTNGMKIVGNNIQYSNNCGISTWPGEFSNSLIQGNRIANNGLVPGAGDSGDLGQEAIATFGAGNIIEYNHIVNSGYTGIRFSAFKKVGGSNIVRYNYIDSFCLVKDDGAGIYTWNNSPDRVELPKQFVQNNIVINAIGNSFGTNSERPEAYGIYMDDNVSMIEVSGNTVANTYFGIFNHNAHHISYLDNILYNNHAQAVWSRDRPIVIEGLDVRGNVFFSKARQNTARFWDIAGENTIASFGTFDNNFYCNPEEKDGPSINIIEPKKNGINNTFTLQQWNSAAKYGRKDKNSKPVPVRSKEYLIFNATSQVKAFPLRKKCIDLKGKKYAGTIRLKPFESMIVFEMN